MDLPNYIHLCKGCQGIGACACTKCDGAGKIKSIFSSSSCKDCDGRGEIRCPACAGRSKLAVCVLPAVLNDNLEGLDEAARAAEIERRINEMVNYVVDSYEPFPVSGVEKSLDKVTLESDSTARLLPGGSIASAFKEVNEDDIVHRNNSIFRGFNHQTHNLRFVGRLTAATPRPGYPGQYDYVLQCYRLDTVKKDA